MRTQKRNSAAGVLLFIPLAACLAACGADAEYNYSVPDAICDTAVDSEALRALLSPGDTIEVAPRDTDVETCEVRIDDELEIEITGHSPYEPEDPMDYARTNEFEDPEEADLIEGGTGVVWEHGALAGWPCRADLAESYNNVLAVIHVFGDHADGDDRKDLIADFARGYMAGLSEKLECDV